MGDQHEEAPHTQDIQHGASSDEEEEDDEEEDGQEPYCLRAVTIGETERTPSTMEEPPIDNSVPPQHEPGRFISSVGHKPRKRCSVLCSVYCVESDFSGELPPAELQLQRPLSDITPRSSLRGTGELPLSPASLELELSPFLISSLADKVLMSCRVCLEDKSLKPLPCCKKGVCEECLKRYLSSQVQLGQVEIKCPITECNKHLDESTILFNLPHDDIIKYKYFLELSRIDSSTKPCPQCKHFTTFKRKIHIPTPSKSENKFKIQCPSCQFVWCFKCHSPWHEGVNCREYKKGDKLLRHWANEIEYGQRNAQKCPRCKVHIQRTEGCDHMTCSQCNTNFCYRCGERYRQLRFFGDHTSNLSIFGCKYRYLPERPHLGSFLLHPCSSSLAWHWELLQL
ncbi:E3 ubiquitin-protein ligase RNF217 isoform X2 [Hyla sarda]|uniref:E3 ubiquitin-protein ligase RNF217 isoform X2 n=1 Tax=Hyla sarda TaxID=327740 RepID=UPI0024C43D72|nr:E3 ubiquitin-protein ligase RNF217 isoform X2 [Hyla sarda]